MFKPLTKSELLALIQAVPDDARFVMQVTEAGGWESFDRTHQEIVQGLQPADGDLRSEFERYSGLPVAPIYVFKGD